MAVGAGISLIVAIPESVLRLATALSIGLLLGAERERRQIEREVRSPFGIRTFALVALLGGVTMSMGQPWLLGVACAFVGAAAIVAYSVNDRTDAGLTTEVAFVLTFVLGAWSQDEPALAAGTAVVATLLLAARGRLHRFFLTILTETELRSLLILLVAGVVVLPLAPDRALDPFGVVNPFKVWRLVVAMMAISGVGYVAVRAIGPRFGLPIAGFASGFVSGIATIAAMGERAKNDPRVSGSAAVGAVLTTVATILQMVVVLALSSTAVLREMAWPLGAAIVAALAYGLFSFRRTNREGLADSADAGHPFQLRTALTLAIVLSVVLFASAAAGRWFGHTGVTIAAALAGFADTHAPAVSIAALTEVGRMERPEAVLPILLAFSTNTISKAVVAFMSGPRRYAMLVSVGLGVVLAASWVGWMVGR